MVGRGRQILVPVHRILGHREHHPQGPAAGEEGHLEATAQQVSMAPIRRARKGIAWRGKNPLTLDLHRKGTRLLVLQAVQQLLVVERQQGFQLWLGLDTEDVEVIWRMVKMHTYQLVPPGQSSCGVFLSSSPP